jgi:hypothetical protein
MQLNPLGLLEVSPRHSLVVALIVTPLWLVFRVLLEPGAFNPLEVLVVFGLSFTSYRLGTTIWAPAGRMRWCWRRSARRCSHLGSRFWVVRWVYTWNQ